MQIANPHFFFNDSTWFNPLHIWFDIIEQDPTECPGKIKDLLLNLKMAVYVLK